MPRVPIHDLNDLEFEQLVVLICRELLGSGITSFAPGRDGGKDAKFEGTATAFPSTTAPASGKFIVQAKHTSSPVASCSDYSPSSRTCSAAPPFSTSTPRQGSQRQPLFQHFRFSASQLLPLALLRIIRETCTTQGIQYIFSALGEDLPTAKAAKDEATLVARNRYLLDEFPLRDRERPGATTPTPTP